MRTPPRQPLATQPEAGGQWIGGLHSVRALLLRGGERVREIRILAGRRDGRLSEILQQAQHREIRVREATRQELDALMAGLNHQGVAALVRPPEAIDENELRDYLLGLGRPPFLLVLDQVQDPHNLGACLRTAEAAGVDAVIAPKDRAVGLTPIVCKVASGAAETLRFAQVTNLSRTLDWLGQELRVWVVGTAAEAERSLYETDLRGGLALVMGGEEEGMRRLTREHCDQLIKLPMAGSVESLNVSVAAGICLFEAVRQRSASPAPGK